MALGITITAIRSLQSRERKVWKIARFSLAAVAVTLGSLCATSVLSQHKVPMVGILWHAANLEEEMVMFRPFSEGMR